jgi:hypothetical protein
MNNQYSTGIISNALVEDIKRAITGKEYGSVEIYIEGGRVVQITERVIKKTVRSNGNSNGNKKNEVVFWKPIKNRK